MMSTTSATWTQGRKRNARFEHKIREYQKRHRDQVCVPLGAGFTRPPSLPPGRKGIRNAKESDAEMPVTARKGRWPRVC
jgi:hypothetical protein